MNQKTGLWQRLYKYKVHHVLLWMVYVVVWVSILRGQYPFRYLVTNTFFYMIFNAISFYFVTYYLLPRYLYLHKYAKFFGLLILNFVVCSAGLAACLLMVIKQMNIPYHVTFGSAFFMAFMSTLTMVGILTAGKVILEKIRSDRNVSQLERQRLETELQYLKAQVNPHFLFNAINSVYFLIKKDPAKASETLIKLSDLLRFQLYDCSDEMIPIEKELEYIQNYIALEKLRKGEKVKVIYQKDNNLSGFLIAPFMLIPFLENAFKFISNHSDKSNEIRINLERDDNRFKATFFNTHDNSPRNDVGGIGLKNVKRRLELLYAGNYELNIEAKPDTYCVTLSLNIV